MTEEEEKQEKREMIAAGCLIGLVAAGGTFDNTPSQLAERAFDLAEAFLAESEKRNAR